MPSIFLEDGKALYDQLGPYFTLLDFGGHDTSAFASAAKRRNVPLSIFTVKEAAARGVYGNGMLLVRPDHHIAWRGPTTENADRVLGMAAGWGESQ
ncbi:aromatic-ring hydroxylase C-terminal domain-containing protein [Bradyrhizobium sp. USDA 4486]